MAKKLKRDDAEKLLDELTSIVWNFHHTQGSKYALRKNLLKIMEKFFEIEDIEGLKKKITSEIFGA